MIADTSIWIDYLKGKKGSDLDFFQSSLQDGSVIMAPVVLSELLSSRFLPESTERELVRLEFALPRHHFWVEAGLKRRSLAKLGFNASLADCLIVQTCVEYNLPLLTRDQELKRFAPKLGVNVLKF